MNKIFLTAEWRKLILANYIVDPELLKPFIPKNTELDYWHGNCYVSLVGFLFLNTRVKGFKIPWHINFEEVNLRFYVKYRENYSANWKRGVVFIQEIVPRRAISMVANTLYHEHYKTLSMNHSVNNLPENIEVEYKWLKSKWNSLKVLADNKLNPILAGAEEEFISEHYWGYTSYSANKTLEYQVEHPTWKHYGIKKYEINVDFSDVYGKKWTFLNNKSPDSIFLFEGSGILVRKGLIIQ